MMKLKDKMTPAELADCLGLARQTINRWVREKQWRTEAIPGVKGASATGGYRPTGTRVSDQHPCQTPSAYRQSSRGIARCILVNEADAIWRQITETLQLMTPAEQLQLRDLLAREGISGFLARLGIASPE